jgi:hypothetical protein
MNQAKPEPALYRSEAFAEDVLDLVEPVPLAQGPSRRARWLVNGLPAAVALIGVAFGVLPPPG